MADVTSESADSVGAISKFARNRPSSLKLEPLLHSNSLPTITPQQQPTNVRAVNISFSDLSYSVKTGIKRGKSADMFMAITVFKLHAEKLKGW